jgi:predicted ester cyclase
MLTVERVNGSLGFFLGGLEGRRRSMSAEENKALVRREQEELWNHTGNLDAAQELFVPDHVEAAKQEAADVRRGFPDVRNTIEDLIVEGDKVVVRWRAQATHQGEYMGIPPTGNRVDFTGIAIYRIEGGKIAESWAVSDRLGLMRQLGAIPEPGQQPSDTLSSGQEPTY